MIWGLGLGYGVQQSWVESTQKFLSVFPLNNNQLDQSCLVWIPPTLLDIKLRLVRKRAQSAAEKLTLDYSRYVYSTTRR